MTWSRNYEATQTEVARGGHQPDEFSATLIRDPETSEEHTPQELLDRLHYERRCAGHLAYGLHAARRTLSDERNDAERAWEMLRDSIGIPQDTAHGPYLADMVCEHIAQLTTQLRQAKKDLTQVRAERDEYLTTLLRASIAVRA